MLRTHDKEMILICLQPSALLYLCTVAAVYRARLCLVCSFHVLCLAHKTAVVRHDDDALHTWLAIFRSWRAWRTSLCRDDDCVQYKKGDAGYLLCVWS